MRPTLTFIKSQLRDFAAFALHYADVRIVAAFDLKAKRFAGGRPARKASQLFVES